MVFPSMHYLRKLFPDIDCYVSLNLPHHNTLDQSADILNILVNYFNNKNSQYTLSISEHSLEKEAKYIHKVFPDFQREYIFDQLTVFNDMPDRIEIVLRILIDLVTKKRRNNLGMGNKRSSPNSYVDNTEDQIPNKIIKLVLKPTENYNTCTVSSSSQETININNNTNVNNSETDKNEDKAIRDSSNLIKQDQEERYDYNNELTDSDMEFMDNMYGIHKSSIEESRIDYAKVSTLTNEFVENTEELDKTLLTDLQFRPLNEDFAVAYLNNTMNMYENIENATPSTSSVSPHHNFPTFLPRTGKPSTVTSENNNNKEVADLTHSVPITNEASILQETGPVLHTSVSALPQDPPREVMDANVITTSNNTTTEPLVIPIANQPNVLQEGSRENVFDINQCAVVAPSTSEQADAPQIMNDGANHFDLIAHLQEISNAPLHFIRSECRKFGVPVNKRPSPFFLNALIGNLIDNNVDDSNDSEESVTLVRETIEKVCDDAEMPVSFPKSLPAPTTSNVENSTVINVDSTPVQNMPSVPDFEAATGGAKRETVISGAEPVKTNKNDVNTQLVNHLCGIFPEACPTYIRGLCNNKPMSNEVLDQLITIILDSDNYPKRPPPTIQAEVFPENQLEILKEFLPDADPDYLRMKFDSFEGKPEKVKAFINEAMEHKNYPKLKDYLRRQQLSAQQKQYTTEFSVENFVKVIPDPQKFFSDPSRTIKMDDASSHYALVFLRNTFNRLPVRTIQSAFSKNYGKLSVIIQTLEEMSKVPSAVMKSKRKAIELPKNLQNIPLLQEIAYYMYRSEVSAYLERRMQEEEAERKDAINNGTIRTCGCCYDEEVLPKDIFTCENGCEFCKSCIVTSTEVRFGEGKLDYPCLMNCESHFSLQTLQSVLAPKLFSKIAQKKALEEVKAAGIEELEFCPFCDFATIPAEGYTVFSCLNPDCMKESCRSCKEPSHIPLRCDEIEKDEEVKARTYVEDKMTEALLRKCWKCGVKFFKEEGCNKMTCSCGARMCYICGKPVTDYRHFNGNGGSRIDLCPLYSDAIILNKENVLKGAEAAKAEIGVDTFKHDPTADVQQYYKDRAKKNPQAQYLVAPPEQIAQLFIWGQQGRRM